MEGLHVTIEHDYFTNAFRGFPFGCMEIFHLFYADDAILLSSWSVENAKKIVCIFRCFHLVFGLKINLFKSKLIWVGVVFTHVEEVAGMMWYESASIPFVYFGNLVGQNTARVSAGCIFLECFRSKFSVWKPKSLSIGGCLTLLKCVLGSLGSYWISMFPIPLLVLRYLESMRARNFFGG